MMNHRCSERRFTAMPALLRTYGGLIPAVIRNVSAGGLYVETANHLPDRSSLVVRVRLGTRGDSSCHEFPAMVIHRENKGAGLMLSEVDEDGWWMVDEHRRSRSPA